MLFMVKEKCGGMKKKLNSVIDSIDVSVVGLCLWCIVIVIMVVRNNMMMLVRLKIGCMRLDSVVVMFIYMYVVI